MDKHELFALIEQGDLKGLRSALDNGAEAGARDGQGVSLLQAAAAKGSAEMVRLLLDRGAEVNKTSDAGNSALMAAAARGHREVLEILLSAGADPAAKNKWGLGAADWAKWAPDSGEIVSLMRTP